MLPFLNPKKLGAVVMAKVKANGQQSVSHEEGSTPPEYMSAAQALIEGVHAKDAEKVAKALMALEESDDASEKE